MEKERKIKIISLVALLVTVLGLTVAFAALSQTLTINGSANVDSATWNIHFEEQNYFASCRTYYLGESGMNYNDDDTHCHGNGLSNDKKIININYYLTRPGNAEEIDFRIVNEGTIDAVIDDIKINEPSNYITDGYVDETTGEIIPTKTATDEEIKLYKENVIYRLFYTDTNEELKKGDVIKAGNEKNVTIRYEYKMSATDIPKLMLVTDNAIEINYVQK